MSRRKAVVIGAGIGGISCAMRLQSLGSDTDITAAQVVSNGHGTARLGLAQKDGEWHMQQENLSPSFTTK